MVIIAARNDWFSCLNNQCFESGSASDQGLKIDFILKKSHLKIFADVLFDFLMIMQKTVFVLLLEFQGNFQKIKFQNIFFFLLTNMALDSENAGSRSAKKVCYSQNLSITYASLFYTCTGEGEEEAYEQKSSLFHEVLPGLIAQKGPQVQGQVQLLVVHTEQLHVVVQVTRDVSNS